MHQHDEGLHKLTVKINAGLKVLCNSSLALTLTLQNAHMVSEVWSCSINNMLNCLMLIKLAFLKDSVCDNTELLVTFLPALQ